MNTVSMCLSGCPQTNTHSFTYNGGSTGNLLIDAETLNYGNSGLTRTMDHSQDTFLRPLTHDLKDGSTSEHLVDMGYSITDGRLSTITDNTASNNGGAKTFSYNYQAANYYLIQNCTTPVHTTTNSYEPDRDILTNKGNSVPSASSVVSSYSYITNNIGQRTEPIHNRAIPSSSTCA